MFKDKLTLKDLVQGDGSETEELLTRGEEKISIRIVPEEEDHGQWTRPMRYGSIQAGNSDSD